MNCNENWGIKTLKSYGLYNHIRVAQRHLFELFKKKKRLHFCLARLLNFCSQLELISLSLGVE